MNPVVSAKQHHQVYFDKQNDPSFHARWKARSEECHQLLLHQSERVGEELALFGICTLQMAEPQRLAFVDPTQVCILDTKMPVTEVEVLRFALRDLKTYPDAQRAAFIDQVLAAADRAAEREKRSRP